MDEVFRVGDKVFYLGKEGVVAKIYNLVNYKTKEIDTAYLVKFELENEMLEIMLLADELER